MNPGAKLRRRTVLALAVLAVSAATALVPSSASAAFDPVCNGRMSLGPSRAEGTIALFFSCSEPIGGFALYSVNREIQEFETELTATHYTTGEATGDLSCVGELPGDSFGCSAARAIPAPSRISAQFAVAGDPCTGRRPLARFYVSSPKGELAGPYTLVNARPGPATRPLDGCPPPPRRVVRRTVRR